MDNFKHYLRFKNINYEKKQWIYDFSNGFSASVIYWPDYDKVLDTIFNECPKNPNDKYEIALIKNNKVKYDNNDFQDVIKYLPEKDVGLYLKKIKNLNKNHKTYYEIQKYG